MRQERNRAKRSSRKFPNVEIGDAQIGLAQRMSAEQQVDCVLFGRVFAQGPQKRLAGLKERSLGRLYLPLVSAEGILIWKPELPLHDGEGGQGPG